MPSVYLPDDKELEFDIAVRFQGDEEVSTVDSNVFEMEDAFVDASNEAIAKGTHWSEEFPFFFQKICPKGKKPITPSQAKILWSHVSDIIEKIKKNSPNESTDSVKPVSKSKSRRKKTSKS